MSQDTLERGDGSARDAVDTIVEQWRSQRPDLDPAAKHVTGRIVRLAALFQEAFADAFAPLGITDGEFGILSPLRRAGEPFTLSPTEIARHRMITSGGLTPALDKLERKGLISRAPNPRDRRSRLVTLTPLGRETVDAAMALHAETERRLVAALDPDDADVLTRLLRRLVVDLDPR